MRRKWMPAVAAGVYLLGLAGCGESPSEPPLRAGPGVLTVYVATPNADDRAMVLHVTGPGPVSAVTGDAGQTVFSRTTATGFNAAVFGDLPTGPVMRFSVPDVSRVADYRAVVVEAVDPQDRLRPSLEGYDVTVAH